MRYIAFLVHIVRRLRFLVVGFEVYRVGRDSELQTECSLSTGHRLLVAQTFAEHGRASKCSEYRDDVLELDL